MRSSFKTKLILGFGGVVVLVGAISIVTGLRLIGRLSVAEAQSKVQMDLNTAREVYQGAMDNVKNTVVLAADRDFIREALVTNISSRLKARLKTVSEREWLDMILIADAKGRAFTRADGTVAPGESSAQNPFLQQALEKKKPVAGTWIVPRSELLKYGSRLADQASVDLVDTPMAKKIERTREDSGMVLAAAAPVMDSTGRLLGAVYGAKLLNRNYDIVDKSKAILYRDERYQGREIGTVTIFQDDIRVSTNVLNLDGTRAIGTRAWAKVHDKVLVEGIPWIARAFVVNDWYLSAYEPIRDIGGKAVGMLYVGVLEKRFTDIRNQGVAIFTAIVFLGMLATFAVAYFLSTLILKPVRVLVDASHRLAGGDFSGRVPIGSKDEIGELGRTFNTMSEAIQKRDDDLKKSAQERIVESERLAILGRLSAGVAHELNNPLGGILIYSHLLLDDTPKGDPRRENLEKIARETTRCRDIVRGLLDFARQHDLQVGPTDINNVLEKTLALVEHQSVFQNIRVEKQFGRDLPPIQSDRGKLQQVLLNVIMNAAEAMEGKAGVLKIATRRREREGRLEISVSDTGCGITPEDMKKVFEPFFTTKGVGKGVGLGLAISYGIIEKHGGTIEIQSEVGKGTMVTIILPAG